MAFLTMEISRSGCALPRSPSTWRFPLHIALFAWLAEAVFEVPSDVPVNP
jgi:hypothetical protein